MENYKIMVVDDEKDYRRTIALLLEGEGYEVESVSCIEEAKLTLTMENIRIAIVDLMLGKENGLDLLSFMRSEYPDIEVIVVSAFATVDSAVEAMKGGAFSYYIKSEDPTTLLMDLSKIKEVHRLKDENHQLRRGGVLLRSKNPMYNRLLSMCKRVAASPLSVLILGESGAGKEVIARYIHEESLRSCGPFVPVHCQMYARGLLESELFGHEKGSFTGASTRHIGKFEEAHRGTLFLDELGDMEESIQVKLLRVLEDQKIERLGGEEMIELDFRLISATNRPEVDGGVEGLREDLFYRVGGIVLHVPPLRERKEDIPSLVHFFMENYSLELNYPIEHIEDEAMELLKAYSYPGNIRELRNLVERLVVLSDHMRITREDVLLQLPSSMNMETSSLRGARAKFEKEHIARELQRNNYHLEETAQALDITRRQLNNKLLEYNLRNWLESRTNRK